MTTFITRDTRVPTLTERLAGYFQRSAILRASASLGDEHALNTAPNVVAIRPAHRLGKIEAITLAVRLHCRAKGYPRWVDITAADTGVLRLRHGASLAGAIASAKVRADFAAQYGTDPEAA